MLEDFLNNYGVNLSIRKPVELIYNHRTQGRGGEGVHIASLVRALQKLGHGVMILSPPGVDPLLAAGVTPVDKGQVKVRGIHRLWKWISRYSPDILFELFELAYNLYIPIRLVPLFIRKPQAAYYERYAFFMLAGVWIANWMGHIVVLEVNEVAGVHRARNQVLVPLSKWIERILFRKADAIVTVSSFLRQEIIRRGGVADRVHVLPNAVDPEAFGAAAGRGEDIRKELKLENALVIGFVGWFDRWDRLDMLIEVARDLRNSWPQLRVLLVGGGPVEVELREKVNREQLEEMVILTGPIPRSRVPWYIDAMNICVLPDSNVFGSPLVLFEFMAMGKPVIAPDLLPIRDVLTDSETGLLIEPRNQQALRAALAHLLGSPALRQSLGAQAKRKVLCQHTWSANATRVMELAGQQRL